MTDFYFNSCRLVPANFVWGAALVAHRPPRAALAVWALAAPLALAIPTAGLFRLAALIVRGEPGISLARLRGRHAPVRFLLGLAFVGAGVILGTNIVRPGRRQPVGLVIGTLAAWGLVALWCGLVAWPVSSIRRAGTARASASACGCAAPAYPVGSPALGAGRGRLRCRERVLAAALLTVGVAFVALVACRSVYPAADRLEQPDGERRDPPIRSGRRRSP